MDYSEDPVISSHVEEVQMALHGAGIDFEPGPEGEPNDLYTMAITHVNGIPVWSKIFVVITKDHKYKVKYHNLTKDWTKSLEMLPEYVKRRVDFDPKNLNGIKFVMENTFKNLGFEPEVHAETETSFAILFNAQPYHAVGFNVTYIPEHPAEQFKGLPCLHIQPTYSHTAQALLGKTIKSRAHHLVSLRATPGIGFFPDFQTRLLTYMEEVLSQMSSLGH